jgi:CO/xanthine dehydrogenase Mo-binding subunit
LAEYALPSACDVPAVTGVGAALAAAIDDAISMPGAVTELPATPRRIRTLLPQIDG